MKRTPEEIRDAAAKICEDAAQHWETQVYSDTSGRMKKARVLRRAAASIRALPVDVEPTQHTPFTALCELQPDDLDLAGMRQALGDMLAAASITLRVGSGASNVVQSWTISPEDDE